MIEARTTLPRRANTIREVAAQLAAKKLTEVVVENHRSNEVRAARQAVSDRIGYAIAAVLGATVLHFGTWWAVAAVVGVHIFSAVLSWKRYKRLVARQYSTERAE